MLFSWFDAKEATDFGVALADTLVSKFPATEENRKKKTIAKQMHVIQVVLAKAQQFRLGAKLNFYKKAKLGNAFRWRLTDLGYDKDFVDELTKEVLLALN